jgi:hypothetical protein
MKKWEKIADGCLQTSRAGVTLLAANNGCHGVTGVFGCPPNVVGRAGRILRLELFGRMNCNIYSRASPRRLAGG